MTWSLWVDETNPASYIDGAKYTPRSNIRWKKRLKIASSQAVTSANDVTGRSAKNNPNIPPGNFATWPHLSLKAVQEHFPESDETQQGTEHHHKKSGSFARIGFHLNSSKKAHRQIGRAMHIVFIYSTINGTSRLCKISLARLRRLTGISGRSKTRLPLMLLPLDFFAAFVGHFLCRFPILFPKLTEKQNSPQSHPLLLKHLNLLLQCFYLLDTR